MGEKISEGLKPCPFCGSDHVRRSMKTDSDGGEFVAVECRECGANVPGDYNLIGDRAVQDWNDRIERTCYYSPDVVHVVYDDDDNEVETGETHPDGCDYACSECGGMMLGGELGWFDETRGKYGGWNYKPRFSFCPYCGAKVVKK